MLFLFSVENKKCKCSILFNLLWLLLCIYSDQIRSVWLVWLNLYLIKLRAGLTQSEVQPIWMKIEEIYNSLYYIPMQSTFKDRKLIYGPRLCQGVNEKIGTSHIGTIPLQNARYV